MPEKIEVLLFSKKLEDICKGKELKFIHISQGPYSSSEKPKYLKFREKMEEYTPHVVKGVRTKGKYMYFLLDGKYKALTVHHGMEGSWCTDSDNKNIILELHISDSNKLYFQDSRRFGTFDLLSEKELESKLLEIGPDVFFEIKNYPEFSAIISLDSKAKKKRLCEVLLDQSFISGIGNYLRADIMYHSKLNPERLLGSLSEEEIQRLYWSMKTVLKNCYEKGGTTTGRYPSSIHIGGYDFLIYGKKETPEGEKIESFKDKQKRTVWWVPTVQN